MKFFAGVGYGLTKNWLDSWWQYRVFLWILDHSPGFCAIKKVCLVDYTGIPRPPIDSIMRLMTVWRITVKIIRTTIIDTYAQL